MSCRNKDRLPHHLPYHKTQSKYGKDNRPEDSAPHALVHRRSRMLNYQLLYTVSKSSVTNSGKTRLNPNLAPKSSKMKCESVASYRLPVTSCRLPQHLVSASRPKFTRKSPLLVCKPFKSPTFARGISSLCHSSG